ncbi:MAG: hypothetical protein IV100_00330 [Myxococcales bacterium]|nr:hypothetical protein [Myxococcales bacterium]
MRPFSLAAFSALALFAPALASAQLRADLSVGFASISDSFDNKGERKDFKDPGPDGATQKTEDFLVPINIGLKYGFFRGLYAGAELSVLSISSEDANRENKKSAFGVRELDLAIGWRGNLAVIDLGIEAGFKIDLGKKPKDLKTDELATSDNNHAFHIGLEIGKSLMPAFGVGVRLNSVIHLERDLEQNNTSVKSGVVVDPALFIYGEIGLNPIAVFYGLDLGFLYRTADETNDVPQEATIDGKTDELDHYLLHLGLHVGVRYGAHSLKVALSMEDEDATTGIPLIGKAIPAATVPVTISYGFRM